MSNQNWVDRWDHFRTFMGPTPSSPRRREVEKLLKTRPCLLYWGDSWFSTPLYANLAKQSMARVDGVAMLVGRPGATAAGLFTQPEIKKMVGWLKAYPFDALLLSAGGNDELSTRLEKMFAPWLDKKKTPPAKLTPAQAFAEVVASKTLDGVFQRYCDVLDGMAPVLKKNPNFRVVGHTYALLERIGVPAKLTPDNIGLIAILKDKVGPWLWPTMQHVVASQNDAKDFSHRLLRDGFRDRVLVPLARQYPGLFTFADFTGVPQTTQATFWNDEIHPTQAGFALLAGNLNAMLRAALPTAKQGAVT